MTVFSRQRWLHWVAALAALLFIAPYQIQAASLDPQTLAVGVIGIPYDQTITAPNTLTLPVTWSIVSGSLPTSLSLGSGSGYSVDITGTPTIMGTWSFRLRATGANSISYELPYTLVVEKPMVISPTSIPPATVGNAYTTTFSVVEGTAPYSWYVSSGSLPVGISLNANGTLSGTPTSAGTFPISISVRDSYGIAMSESLSLVVNTNTNPISITTTNIPIGTANASYVAYLSASGGTSPYTWMLVSGALPNNLTLSSNGTIQGTPSTAGTYAFSVRATDAVNNTSERSFLLTVQTSSGSSDLDARLANFNRIGVHIHELVKLPDDGNPFTQYDSAVYYLGTDGRRHAFPDPGVYFTWYADFSQVQILNSGDLASIPLGANVTYHPGTKMVKFDTDPKTYVVTGNRVLRWVANEGVAAQLYGPYWNTRIDDIQDTFYTNYLITVTNPVYGLSDYNPDSIRSAYTYPSDVLP